MYFSYETKTGWYIRGQGLRLRWRKLEKGGYDDDGYEQEGGKGR